jgi:subtilisin family serine protease
VVDRQYLLVVENSLLGHALKQQLVRQFALDVIEEFNLQSLSRSVLVFQTDHDSRTLLNELRSRKGVLGAQADYIYRVQTDHQAEDSSEPMEDLQSLARHLDLAGLHRRSHDRDPLVAVIDTGIQADHPDFAGAAIETLNLFSEDSYHAEIHGTAVTGIIAAQKNNRGIIGLAPRARILALRACRQLQARHPAAECFSRTIARGLDQAISRQAQLVNISVGTPGADPLIASLLDVAGQNGLRVVAAAGNETSQEQLWFPASHGSVIAVAGHDADRYWPNARVAQQANMLAPGDQIFTTVPDGRYNFLNGSSMSAAIATGLLSLANEDARPAEGAEAFCTWVNRLLGEAACRP